MKTSTCISFIAAFLLNFYSAAAYEERNIIMSELDGTDLVSLHMTDGNWFPYPEYADREAWAELFGNSAEKVVREAEKYEDYAWTVIPASAYLEYERSGDRQVMEKPYEMNRRVLNMFALAELDDRGAQADVCRRALGRGIARHKQIFVEGMRGLAEVIRHFVSPFLHSCYFILIIVFIIAVLCGKVKRAYDRFCRILSRAAYANCAPGAVCITCDNRLPPCRRAGRPKRIRRSAPVLRRRGKESTAHRAAIQYAPAARELFQQSKKAPQLYSWGAFFGNEE